MTLLAVGYPHSPAAQILKELNPKQGAALISDFSELDLKYFDEGQVLLALYSSYKGYDWQLCRRLISDRLFVTGAVQQENKLILAAKNPRFNTLLLDSEKAHFLPNLGRLHRGLNTQIVATQRQAIQQSFSDRTCAVICSQAEAKGFGLEFQYDLDVKAERINYFLIGKKLPSVATAMTLLEVVRKRDLNSLLLAVAHFCKENELNLKEVVQFPDDENLHWFFLEADYRMAKLRKLITQLEDMQLVSRVIVRGAF